MKGFQIHGPSIHIEVKLRRLTHGGEQEQLADWIKDLIKLASWIDSWYDNNKLHANPENVFFQFSLSLVICLLMRLVSGMFCVDLPRLCASV